MLIELLHEYELLFFQNYKNPSEILKFHLEILSMLVFHTWMFCE